MGIFMPIDITNSLTPTPKPRHRLSQFIIPLYAGLRKYVKEWLSPVSVSVFNCNVIGQAAVPACNPSKPCHEHEKWVNFNLIRRQMAVHVTRYQCCVVARCTEFNYKFTSSGSFI